MKCRWDFICSECGYFEIFDEYKTEMTCIFCGNKAEQVWLESPGMQPDDFWSGHSKFQKQLAAEGIHINSKSEAERLMKEHNLTVADNGTRRDARRNYEYKLEKQNKDRHDFLERMVLDDDFQKEAIHKAETIDK